jgi:hypothetical protein
MNRNLVITSHQVNFGKDGAARWVMAVILDVENGITVGDSACVEGLLISKRPPNAVLLGHKLMSR